MFMAFEGYALNDVTIFRAMEIVAARQGLAVLHAENFDIIKELRRTATKGETGPESHLATCPSVTEGEAVHRVIACQAHRRTPPPVPPELRGGGARDPPGEGARAGRVR